MKKHSSCNFESSIVKALKSGLKSEEISAHLEMCESCREAARVVQFFQTNLPKESSPKNLPVAGFFWWKFQLHEKRRHAERVGQPLLIAQIIAAVAFAVLLVWIFNSDTLLDSAFNRIFAVLEQLIVPLIAGIIGFLFVSLTLIFTLRRFLLEK